MARHWSISGRRISGSGSAAAGASKSITVTIHSLEPFSVISHESSRVDSSGSGVFRPPFAEFFAAAAGTPAAAETSASLNFGAESISVAIPTRPVARFASGASCSSATSELPEWKFKFKAVSIVEASQRSDADFGTCIRAKQAVRSRQSKNESYKDPSEPEWAAEATFADRSSDAARQESRHSASWSVGQARSGSRHEHRQSSSRSSRERRRSLPNPSTPSESAPATAAPAVELAPATAAPAVELVQAAAASASVADSLPLQEEASEAPSNIALFFEASSASAEEVVGAEVAEAAASTSGPCDFLSHYSLPSSWTAAKRAAVAKNFSEASGGRKRLGEKKKGKRVGGS